MGSRIANESGRYNETNLDLEECKTLPSSHYRLRCRKHQSSSKSLVLSKRLKTGHETENLWQSGIKPIERETTEEKEYTLRRSKRKKKCDSSIQMEEMASSDEHHNLKNDAEETKGKTLQQNCGMHLIPEHIIRSLDKELFPEDSEEEQNLCTKWTDELRENKLIYIKPPNPPMIDIATNNSIQQAANMSDHETATREIEYDSRSQPNSQQIFREVEIIADNENDKKQTDTKKEILGENRTRDTTEIFLDTFQHNEKFETNNTKFIINEVASDPNFDLLYIDIKKADDIINSLAESVDVENNCSVNRHSTDNYNSNPAYSLSKNDSKDENFYDVEDKDIDSVKNNVTLSDNLSHPVILSKSDLEWNEQQKNSLKNNNEKENKQNEGKKKISDCSNSLDKEENYPGAEFNSLDHEDTSHLFVSLVIRDKQNKTTEMLHKCDSSEEFRNQSSSVVKVFPIENGDFHDFDNSYNSKIQIQNSYMKTNYIEDAMDKTKMSIENLEVKQKKLTLLYMSALDYENATEIIGKGSGIKNESLHSDTVDKSMNNITLNTQKDTGRVKQDFKDFSQVKNENNSEITLGLQIHQNENKREPKEYTQPISIEVKKNNDVGIGNTNEIIHDATITDKDNMKNEEEEFKEYTWQNLIEMKKDNFEMESTNEIIYETIITTEKHNSKNEELKEYTQRNLIEMKKDDDFETENDSTSSKEINKMHDFQKEFTTPQFHDKILTLPPISSNTFISSNEANVEEEDTTFTLTDDEWLQSEENKSSKEMENDGRVDNIKLLQHSITSHEDVEENFDMDDDFDLTASQINMIDVNENNGYKESNEENSHTKKEKCNDTHFGQDSLTVEIINQLCYIRESVDSIKEQLKTLLTKSEERK